MKWIDPCVVLPGACLAWKHGKCNLCIDHFGCVAFHWQEAEGRVGPVIEPAMCTGCQLCFQVCPVDAIVDPAAAGATAGPAATAGAA